MIYQANRNEKDKMSSISSYTSDLERDHVPPTQEIIELMYFDSNFFDTIYEELTYSIFEFVSENSHAEEQERCEKEFRREKLRKNINSKRIDRLKKKIKNSSIPAELRTKIRKLKKKPAFMQSESGLAAAIRGASNSFAERFQMFQASATNEKWDKGFDIVETLVLTFLALKDAKNATQFVSILLLAIKTQCKNDSSLYKQFLQHCFGSLDSSGILDYFDLSAGVASHEKSHLKTDLMLDDFGDTELESEFQSEAGFIDLIEGMKQCVGLPSALKNSAVIKKLYDLIAMLLALGFISETKELSYSVEGMDIFRVNATKGRKTLVDLLEVIMESASFFCERGYRCFQQGSIMPLFLTEEAALLFEKDYTELVAGYQFVEIGNYAESPFLDERDFDLRLANLTEICSRLLASVPKGERPYVQKRYQTLLTMRANFEIRRTSGGLRPAPFSFLVHGTSSIAKSSIVNNLMTFSLQSMARFEGKKEFVVDPRMICTLNEMDKYHSDYKSHIQAVLLDDLANANPKTVDVNPTVNIINFVNNIRRTAIMAEADLKGKIPLEPRVVCATTNVWKSWAKYYSQEPLSVLRRFQYHIKARVREEFQKEGTTMIDGKELAKEAAVGNFTPDAWLFDVVEFVGVQNGDTGTAQIPTERPIVFKGRELTNVDFGLVMQLFAEVIPQHCEIQKSVVNTSEKTFTRTLCDHGLYPEWCKTCTPTLTEKVICKPVVENVTIAEIPAMTEQQIEGLRYEQELANSIAADYRSNRETSLRKKRNGKTLKTTKRVKFNSEAGNVYREQVARIAESYRSFDWADYIPDPIFERGWCQWSIFCTRSSNFFQRVKAASFACFSAGVCTAFMAPSFLPIGIATYVAGLSIAITARKKYLIDQISRTRDLLPELAKTIRRFDAETGKTLCWIIAAFLALYAIYIVVKRLFALKFESEGNGMSVTSEEENVWLAAALEPLPTGVSERTSGEQLQGCVLRQLAHVTFKTSGKFSNGIFLDSNLLLLPTHILSDTSEEIEILMRGEGKLSGKNFTTTLHPRDCCPIYGRCNSDLSVCYIARSGSMKNLLKFLPTSYSTRKIMTKLLWKDRDGTSKEWNTRMLEFRKVETPDAKIDRAFTYRLSEKSFSGMCMATHVSTDSKDAFIAGFHLAGTQTSNMMCAAEMLTRQQVEECRTILEDSRSVFFTVSEGAMPTEAYGIDYTPESSIAAKSPSRYQKAGTQASVYGTLAQFQVRPKSTVIPSPLSEEVTKEMGQENLWGPPANCRRDNGVPSWDPYQKYLAGAGNAYQEFPPEVLEWAMDDYMRQIDRLCETEHGKKCLARVRVLNDVESVSGVDGMKFVDAMKPNTSMGFPVNKPKKNWLTDLDPEEYKELTCPRDLDDETKKLAFQAREAYLKDERAYPVFKACTKDEPTKLTKTKVRVFQAAPVSLQLNVRKYFLTVCNFLSSSPLKTECAVGLNSQGPGWHELQEHLQKFGADRIVAGDFKAYDQHMSARMLLCSYKIFMYIAKKAGYSKEELKVMRGIATEVAYPIIFMFKDLMALYGSNPSGQNLTVYTNSIVNSLYQRCVFRQIYPDYQGNFEDAVALTTYGDDNEMGVSKDFPLYNHTRMQEVYAEQGIEYTMADKDAESVPYINHEDADFLKRKSRWCPEYKYVEKDGTIHEGMWLAMLGEDSIFKSLHSNMISKDLAPEEVALQCLDGAMREWWFHGKEVFDRRHAEAKRVLINLNLQDAVSENFYLSFEARECAWMEKYEVKFV